MSGHGHGGGGESHHEGGESMWEYIPMLGKMLKEIAGVDGIKHFFQHVADHFIIPVSLQAFEPIQELMGAGGGGGAAVLEVQVFS